MDIDILDVCAVHPVFLEGFSSGAHLLSSLLGFNCKLCCFIFSHSHFLELLNQPVRLVSVVGQVLIIFNSVLVLRKMRYYCPQFMSLIYFRNILGPVL